MLLSLRESPVRFSEVSCDVGCCSSFQFCSSFCCFSSFCCCCSSHCFSTSSLTFPWTIPRFLHPFYTFSPASPSQSDSRHFHFKLSEIFSSQFYRERYGLEWTFFTHRRFLPYAPSPTFYLRLSMSRWGPAVLP